MVSVSRFHIAFVASGISVLGWAVAAFGVLYLLYAAVTGGAIVRAAAVPLGGLVVGAVFAIIEHRIYDFER